MAKEYEVKCPICGSLRKMMLSDLMRLIVNTSGIRGVEEPKPRSSESLNEENWIDLKDPCPNCHRKFSFNIETGESRE